MIALDHRVVDQIATRRLRVVKYRGSAHATNEYPLMINEHGLSVQPVSSLHLDHVASRQRVSTGIVRLDTMLDGKGYYRGSSVLVSGTAGTGKTSVAAAFADGSARRGATPAQLWWVGVAWLCATVVFEFSFGRFVSGLSWQALLADYNLLRGRLWSLILVSVCLGPWLCGTVRAGR